MGHYVTVEIDFRERFVVMSIDIFLDRIRARCVPKWSQVIFLGIFGDKINHIFVQLGSNLWDTKMTTFEIFAHVITHISEVYGPIYTLLMGTLEAWAKEFVPWEKVVSFSTFSHF